MTPASAARETGHEGEYDAVKCPTCGTDWSSHDPDCPRHDYRPARVREAEARRALAFREALTERGSHAVKEVAQEHAGNRVTRVTKVTGGPP